MRKNRPMLRIPCILILCLLICSGSMTQAADIEIDRKEVIIPSLKKSYTFVIVNDQHLIADTSGLSGKKKAKAEKRKAFFSSSSDSASSVWMSVVKAINQQSPDGVILAGDMVDFYSKSNFQLLRKGLKKIKAPVMYLRADHDLDISYDKKVRKTDMLKAEAALDGNDGIMAMEYDRFILVGINKNTSQITKSQLKVLSSIWAKNKPVILFMHVPLAASDGGALAAASRSAWNNQVLLWGKNCYYKPNSTTRKFLTMVKQVGSPVKAIFAGHLHFSYVSYVGTDITQYVLDASYKGKITVLTVRGKKKD